MLFIFGKSSSPCTVRKHYLTDYYRLQEETGRVEEKLLNESFGTALIRCFTTSKANAFENLLEPLQKLLRLSPLIASAVARPELFSRILQKLTHNKAFVRLNLLKILVTICDATDRKEAIMREYSLTHMIQRLADRDQAILVKNLASELLKSTDRRPMSTSSRRLSKRTQSLSSASPVSGFLGAGHGSPTTQHSTMYFDAQERMRGRGSVERDLSSGRDSGRESNHGGSQRGSQRGERESYSSHSQRARRNRASEYGGVENGTPSRRGAAQLRAGASMLRVPSQPGVPGPRRSPA